MAATESTLLRRQLQYGTDAIRPLARYALFRLFFSSFGVRITSILATKCNRTHHSAAPKHKKNLQFCCCLMAIKVSKQNTNGTFLRVHTDNTNSYIFGGLLQRKHSLQLLGVGFIELLRSPTVISRAFTQFLSLAHSHRALRTRPDHIKTLVAKPSMLSQ